MPAAHHLTWEQAVRLDQQVVVVYQMGKVGSHAVLAALETAAPDRLSLYHVHFMMPEGIRHWLGLAEAVYGGRANLPPSVGTSVARARFLGERLRRDRRVQGKVISLVREPVAWSVSAFFAMEAWWPSGTREACARLATNGDGDQECTATLVRHFLDEFPFHDLPLTWFDTELGPFVGQDVYAEPFPHEKGYQLLEGGLLDVLVLRAEDLPVCAPRVEGVPGCRRADAAGDERRPAEVVLPRLSIRDALSGRAHLPSGGDLRLAIRAPLLFGGRAPPTPGALGRLLSRPGASPR